jgi:hypothetical protein
LISWWVFTYDLVKFWLPAFSCFQHHSCQLTWETSEVNVMTCSERLKPSVGCFKVSTVKPPGDFLCFTLKHMSGILCLTQVDRWRHSVSDVVEYVTTEKLLESVFNTLRVFIRQWEIQTHWVYTGWLFLIWKLSSWK